MANFLGNWENINPSLGPRIPSNVSFQFQYKYQYYTWVRQTWAGHPTTRYNHTPNKVVRCTHASTNVSFWYPMKYLHHHPSFNILIRTHVSCFALPITFAGFANSLAFSFAFFPPHSALHNRELYIANPRVDTSFISHHVGRNRSSFTFAKPNGTCSLNLSN